MQKFFINLNKYVNTSAASVPIAICEAIESGCLKKNDIFYIDRDIHEFEDEYDTFVEATDNEYVPAMMLLTLDDNENASDVMLLAPDRDFQDIYEGVNLVKEYLLD